MNLKSMRERRAGYEAQSKVILDRAEREGRDLTESEADQIGEIYARDRETKRTIEAHEQQGAWGRELDQPANPHLHGRIPNVGGGWDGTSNDGDPDGLALRGWVRSRCGQPSTSQEESACEQAGIALNSPVFGFNFQSHAPMNGASFRFRNASMTRPAKGFGLIGTGFFGSFETASRGAMPMMDEMEVMTTDKGGPMIWPTVDDASSVAGLIGESELLPDTDLSIGATTSISRKATSGLFRISSELARDTEYPLETLIAEISGQRIFRAINKYATAGTGAGLEPQGFLNAASVGKTTASGTAITADELIDLMNSLDVNYRSNAVWCMHPNVAGVIQKLKDAENRYLWSNFADGIAAGSEPKLLGARVVLNSDMPSSLTAGAKSIAFGDFSKVKLRLVQGVRFIINDSRFMEFDEIAMVAHLSFDTFLLKSSKDAALSPIRLLQQFAG